MILSRRVRDLLDFLPLALSLVLASVVVFHFHSRSDYYEQGRAYERGKAYAEDRWNLEPADVMRFCTEHAGSVVLTTDYPQPEAFRNGCSAALNSRFGVSEDR